MLIAALFIIHMPRWKQFKHTDISEELSKLWCLAIWWNITEHYETTHSGVNMNESQNVILCLRSQERG